MWAFETCLVDCFEIKFERVIGLRLQLNIYWSGPCVESLHSRFNFAASNHDETHIISPRVVSISMRISPEDQSTAGYNFGRFPKLEPAAEVSIYIYIYTYVLTSNGSTVDDGSPRGSSGIRCHVNISLGPTFGNIEFQIRKYSLPARQRSFFAVQHNPAGRVESKYYT